MIYNTMRKAYHHTTKFLGHAYREGRKYAKEFDQFMNAAGRTMLTLQPLLDEVAPGARRALTQGLEDYDLVRSRVMSGHATGERYVAQLNKDVPELRFSA